MLGGPWGLFGVNQKKKNLPAGIWTQYYGISGTTKSTKKKRNKQHPKRKKKRSKIVLTLIGTKGLPDADKIKLFRERKQQLNKSNYIKLEVGLSFVCLLWFPIMLHTERESVQVGLTLFYCSDISLRRGVFFFFKCIVGFSTVIITGVAFIRPGLWTCSRGVAKSVARIRFSLC